MADITITVEPRAVPEIQVPASDVPDVLVGGAAWSEILGKPSAFPAAPHEHDISDVTGLQAALDGKAALSHGHTWAEITSKPSTFPPESHAHGWDSGDITGKPTEMEEADATGDPASTDPQLIAGATLAAIIAALAGSGGGIETVDTLNAILATSPPDPALAVATDTEDYTVLVWDGGAWYALGTPVRKQSAPDAGAFPTQNPDGYHRDSVSRKILSACRIGRAQRAESGGVWVSGAAAEGSEEASIFLNGQANEIPVYLSLDRDTGLITYTPGEIYTLYAHTAQSIAVDADGNPIVDEGVVDAGAFGPAS